MQDDTGVTMTGRLGESSPKLHDPVETLSVQALHHSASIAMYDVRCRPHDFARGHEEWSRHNQIVFPRHGVFEREARGQKVIADANHVLFFNRDEAYHVAHPAGCGDDCTVFTFEDALLADAVCSYDPAWADRAGQPFRFTHALNDQAVYFLHDQLRRAALAAKGEELVIDEAAMQLLDALLQGAYRSRGVSVRRARDTTSRTHREQVQRTSLFLATRFSENLSLDAIARATHCSPFHLARVFRQQAGVTIHQYRHGLRLREALRRVGDGEANLSALALSLGFSSHSHLTDAFRQAFGLAPTLCRKPLGSRRLLELSQQLQ
jgi:AraC family transcriptional regulator